MREIEREREKERQPERERWGGAVSESKREHYRAR